MKCRFVSTCYNPVLPCVHIVLCGALQARHKCSAMPWVDCTAVRYQCTRQPDISLCPAAFADGLFPTGTSARDFVRLGASSEQRVRSSGARIVLQLACDAACGVVT